MGAGRFTKKCRSRTGVEILPFFIYYLTNNYSSRSLVVLLMSTFYTMVICHVIHVHTNVFFYVSKYFVWIYCYIYEMHKRYAYCIQLIFFCILYLYQWLRCCTLNFTFWSVNILKCKNFLIGSLDELGNFKQKKNFISKGIFLQYD